MQSQHRRAKVAPIILIVLLTILVKLALFFIFYKGWASQITWEDTNSYLIPAKTLLNTGHFLNANHIPMFFRTPGYPIFIAFVFFLLGPGLSKIIVFQIVLSAVPIISAYVIGLKLGNRKLGLVAAVLISVNYLLLSYTFTVMSDMLFVVFLSLMLMFGVFILSARRPQYSHSFLMGLFMALVTLTRPVSYFLIIPILIGVVLFGLSKGFPKKSIMLMVLLIALPSVVLVGGWQLRNKHVVGTFQYAQVMGNEGIYRYFPKNYELYAKAHDRNQKKNSKLSIGMLQNIEIVFSHPFLTLNYFKQGLSTNFFMLDPQFLQNFLFPDKPLLPLSRVVRNFFKYIHVRTWRDYIRFFSYCALTLLYYTIRALVVLLYLFAVIGIVSALKIKDKHVRFAEIFMLGCALYFILLSSNAIVLPRYSLPMQIILTYYMARGIIFFVNRIKFFLTNAVSRESNLFA